MPSVSRQPSRKSEEVYEGLRDLAITGRLAPQALPLQAIADAYHTSMQPVRDACVRLEADGFVEYEPQRGYFVRPFTVEEQQHLLTALLGIFSTALKIRVSSSTHSFFEKLVETPARTEGVAEDIEKAIESVLEASRNRVLHGFGRLMIARSSRIRRLDLEDPDVAAAATGGLHLIAHAILQQDHTAAESTARMIIEARKFRLGELVELANYRAKSTEPAWEARSFQ